MVLSALTKGYSMASLRRDESHFAKDAWQRVGLYVQIPALDWLVFQDLSNPLDTGAHKGGGA